MSFRKILVMFIISLSLAACGGGSSGDSAETNFDPDIDGDGVDRSVDNCPEVANPDQLDSDSNGVGDLCETDGSNDDSDGDSIPDVSDNCPTVSNSEQGDVDFDGIGDACDPQDDSDSDSDSVRDEIDNCFVDFNPDQSDIDGDGKGDACDTQNDTDTDGDGIRDEIDNCPATDNPDQTDSNGNGTGDSCEGVVVIDTDNDTIPDATDNCPTAVNTDQIDTDGDGIGDVCDTENNTDTDADGITDESDNCPSVANTDQADKDNDGTGDACDTQDDTDSDGDGVRDEADNCPSDANADQADTDLDGVGDVCDSVDDADNDGIVDASDVDTDGDGLIEIDSLAMLDLVRNDLAGTSLTNAEGVANSEGCPVDGCIGYELIADLDFDTNGDGVLDRNDDYFDYGNNLRDEGWLPIGGTTEDKPFAANFNGNNHKISNLYIKRTSSESTSTEGFRIGLFGSIAGTNEKPVEISNLILDGSQSSVTGRSGIGSLAGTANFAIFSNIQVQSDVNAVVPFIFGFPASAVMGGLVGNLNLGKIEDSSFTGNVSASTTMNEEYDDVYQESIVGGLVGYSSSAEIVNSQMEGSVISQADRIGGITGDGNRITINDCTVNAAVSGRQWVGGIAGLIDDYSTISYSTVKGEVSGQRELGGIAGLSKQSELTGTVFSGKVIQQENNYSVLAGGLVGWMVNGSLSNSMFVGKLEAVSDSIGGAIGGANSTSVSSVIVSGGVSGGKTIGGLVGASVGSIFDSNFVNINIVTEGQSAAFIGSSIQDTFNENQVAANQSGDDQFTEIQLTQTDTSIHVAGFSLEELKCPTAGSNITCSDRVIYNLWETKLDPWLLETTGDEVPVWDFGTSDQLPGLLINGKVYRDADGDGNLD